MDGVSLGRLHFRVCKQLTFGRKAAQPTLHARPRTLHRINTPSIKSHTMKLKILVGSMTHTAAMVAQAVQMECADFVANVEIEWMDGLDIAVFDPCKAAGVVFLICISTYGAGDVPDNAQALYQSLAETPRYLGHLRYGVIALGDSTAHAQTFCFGGKQFDARLQDLGGQRIGDLCLLDSGDGTSPEAAAIAWCRPWLGAALLAQAGESAFSS